MTFGLHSGLDTFQRTVVYLDDVIVMRDTVRELLEDLISNALYWHMHHTLNFAS